MSTPNKHLNHVFISWKKGSDALVSLFLGSAGKRMPSVSPPHPSFTTSKKWYSLSLCCLLWSCKPVNHFNGVDDLFRVETRKWPEPTAGHISKSFVMVLLFTLDLSWQLFKGCKITPPLVLLELWTTALRIALHMYMVMELDEGTVL
jgi:hypothetical protein